jgi:hypothetical protein
LSPERTEIHAKLVSLLEETSHKGGLEVNAVLHMLVATSLSGELLEFARHCTGFGPARMSVSSAQPQQP